MTPENIELNKRRQLARRRLALMTLVPLLGLSVWFFSQVWSNVETLSTRTLPGIDLADDLLDCGADLEILRLSGKSGVEGRKLESAQFVQLLNRYESTVVNENDRTNLGRVRDAFTVYSKQPSDDSWQRLRSELRNLNDFRQSRAMLFATESKGKVFNVFLVNFVGMVSFALCALLVSIYFGLRNFREFRPDDF